VVASGRGRIVSTLRLYLQKPRPTCGVVAHRLVTPDPETGNGKGGEIRTTLGDLAFLQRRWEQKIVQKLAKTMHCIRCTKRRQYSTMT
jgi:hypothetical protein